MIHDGSRVPFEGMNRIAYSPYCKYAYIFHSYPIYYAELKQNTDIGLNKEIDMNIFDILNVKGHFEEYNGKIISYVNVKDVARGIGMSHVKVDRRRKMLSTRGEQPFYTIEEFRWNRLKDYYERVVNDMKKTKHWLLPLVTPFNKDGDMLTFIAIGICNICTNDKASYFRMATLERLTIMVDEENKRREN